MSARGMPSTRPWLKFYDEGVPPSLEYPDVPLDRLLADAAAKHPNQPAIVFGGMVGTRLMDMAVSYAQLDELVDQFAAAIQDLGVLKGHRVAIHLPNCPQFVIAFFGTLRAGGIAVPCNPLYTAVELEHQLNDCGAEVMVTLSRFYETVAALRPATRLRHIIWTNIKEYFPPLLRVLFTLTRERHEGHRLTIPCPDDDYGFQTLVGGTPETLPEPVRVSADDTACLLYTGGTTGIPKGAQLLHRNLVSNAVAALAWSHARKAGEVIIGALPLFHSYGMTSVMNMAIAGAMTMVPIPDPRNIRHIMSAISRHRATFYPGVPTMYVAINHHPLAAEFDLSSVQVCLSGAAPLPREVQQAFQELTGSTLVEAYGLTEASPATHVNPLLRNKIGSIGVPFPDTDARIVDAETGQQEMAVGDIGELVVRGPQIMRGYWRQPTETANVLREHPSLGPGLWLHTGDIARMDDEGYFQIVDRKKDMIICGGFSVYPRDVEEVLFKHPAVREAAVVGLPDEYRGETVKACLVLRPGTEASEEEIIAFCRRHLAPYKVPTVIEFRSDLPRSTVGKVLRRELAGR